MSAEELIKLFRIISDQSKEHHYVCYIDSLNRLLKQDQNFCSKYESDFIRNLFLWDINTGDDNSYPLTPILSGYKKNTFEEVLKKFFNENEIELLIKLRENETLNSEILARINDILWCFKHKDKEIKKNRFFFAKSAIEHYCISAQQQQDRNFSITRLIRAIKLINLINVRFTDEQVKLVLENIDINESFDDTLKLFQNLYRSKHFDNKELLKKNQELLDNSYETPKINSDYLSAYYDVFIQYVDDQGLKDIYREKKIKSLLWFAKWEEGKGHYQRTINLAIQAENELAKLKTNKEERDNYRDKIEKYKKNNNKLPEGIRWYYTTNSTPISDITKKLLKNSENLPFANIIKNILIYFENIEYKTIIKSLPPFLLTINLLTSDESGSLTNDEKPKLITYSDYELIMVYSMRIKKRKEISNEISILLGIIRSRILENDLSLLEKHLSDLGLQDRQEIILNSVKFAILGDTCTALHLIIPQLEHFFRIKIQLSSINTSIFTNDNNLEELSITQIFKNDTTAEVLKKEYGHDIFCELYLILLDKRCGNYRNKVCHGKMNFANFLSEESIYAWGLCFYAIFKELFPEKYQQSEICKENVSNEEELANKKSWCNYQVGIWKAITWFKRKIDVMAPCVQSPQKPD